MARTSARQRRLARNQSRTTTAPATPAGAAHAEAPGLKRIPLSRWLLAGACVVLTPLLVLAAARHDSGGTLGAGIRLTVAMVLFQAALVAFRATRPATREGATSNTLRFAAVVVALLAGAALFVTTSIPMAAWLAGLAMFACLALDAIRPSSARGHVATIVLALAFLVCWVFGGVERWDAILWWVFLFAACAIVALESVASQAGPKAQPVITRRMLGAALAGVGLLCSSAALLIAWRAPGAAVLIALEGAFALLFIQRAARRFGARGIFGVAAAACILATAVFLVAV